MWLAPGGILGGGGGAATNVINVTNDTRTVAQGDSVTFSPIANDSAIDGSTLTLGTVSAPGTGNGTLTKSGNSVTYTAPSSGTPTFSVTYAVTSSSGLSASGTITFSVITLNSNLNFYKAGWVNGKAPGSLRACNVGVMAVAGANLNTYKNWCGHTPEIIVATCTGNGIKADDPRRWQPSTWDAVNGGPDNAIDTIQTERSQPNLHYHGQAQDWIKAVTRANNGATTYGVTRSTWFAYLFTMVPYLSELSLCTEVANGQHDNKIKMHGVRLRKLIDGAGQDYRRVIGRPNWEWNQDTGLKIKNRTGAFGGINGFHAAGGSVQQYNDMCGRFFLKFWEGYGHRMPMALSPAFESTSAKGPAETGGIQYADWLISEYDLCCGSFHPIVSRVPNLTAARDVVYSTTSNRYTPARVFAAARANGRKVAFLEHAVSTGLAEWYTGPGLANVAAAYDHFGTICNDAMDEGLMAFTGLLGTAQCLPNFLKSRGDPDWTRWENLCIAYHDRFGRVGYPLPSY
jgi:hypothetical protein